MTAPRRPRSARLLVGSTPSIWLKVQRAGPAFEEVARELSVVLGLRACARGVFEVGAELRLERRDPRLKRSSLGVLLELLPRVEQVVREDEAGVSELLLFAHPFAVGGEVAE